MPSKRLKEYVEADAEEKAAKSKKDSIKSYVQRLMERCKRRGLDVRGVSYYERENIKMKEDEIYEYVRNLCQEPIKDSNNIELLDEDNLPIFKVNEEKFNKFCKLSIDLEKLEYVGKELELSVLPLPSFCYSIETSKVVKIDHKKV